MSIFPLVNPDRYGPYYDRNDSSSGNFKATAFSKLEQFLEKHPDSANQEYKQTFFFADCSICFPCLCLKNEDKEVRPLNAMLLFPLIYPLTGEEYTQGIKLLVKYKADVNHVYRDLKPIHSIMNRRFKGTADIIELFLANGANINDKNSTGSTPLHVLIYPNDIWSSLYDSRHSSAGDTISSLLKLLLKKGALINAQDDNGNTPLHLAVKTQRDEVILVLLSNNCDTTLVNKANQTPLALATSMGKCNTVIIAMLENPEAFIKQTEKVYVEGKDEVEGANQV